MKLEYEQYILVKCRGYGEYGKPHWGLYGGVNLWSKWDFIKCDPTNNNNWAPTLNLSNKVLWALRETGYVSEVSVNIFTYRILDPSNLKHELFLLEI
jgi:hypothetical protein